MTVCKQNRVSGRKFRPFNISLVSFRQILNAHTSDILLSDTNVIFLPLDCGVFFSRYSLSSADKAEKDKDMFGCQIHA